MTVPAVLDRTHRLDPALPGLPAVLSAHPPGTAADARCRVRSVDWVPRRRCRVVQEVRGPEGRTLLAYEVTPSGTTVSRPADDPALPGLPVALSGTRVRSRLAELCRAPVTGCRVTPVAHRPGSRAVVSYDVVAGGGRARFYAKLLAEGSDRYAAAATAIAEAARHRQTRVPVPEVVACWPDLGAVVSRAAPGRTLSDLLRDETLPEPAALRHAERLGRLLAGVHATPCGAVPRWGAEEELAALEALLPPTWHADPATGRWLAALVDSLADTVPPAADPVLAHGAFRTGQVVADGGALTLLDLDTVSGSDPERDAGNAVAYLAWAAIRGALRPGLAPALRDTFTAGYRDARTGLGDEPLAWWSAAAMAKIAGRRFRSLATTEWPGVPDLIRCAAAHLDPVNSAPGPRRPLTNRDGMAADDPLTADRITLALEARTQPGRVRVRSARTLAEAAGRRRVVRYEVEGLQPDHAVPVIGKTYADRHRSWVASANLLALGGIFAATPGLAVPRAICHLPGPRVLLYREVTGTALDRLPAGAAVTVARLAARWLATLHASETVLARRLDLTHEIADVDAWARCVGDLAPEARRPASALADRLAAAAADLPAGRDVPIHKDFHAGHVIAVRDPRAPEDTGAVPSGVAVIDLDEARMGDPALDVAHFTTYLDAVPEPAAHEVREAFLDGYGPVPGPSAAYRSAFFTAYTTMKIAKQLVTGRGPLLGWSGAAQAATVPAVLRKGLTCLDG